MIIYQDHISPHEMFSNTYKIWEVTEGCVWRWRGRWSTGQKVNWWITHWWKCFLWRLGRLRYWKHSNHSCCYCHEPSLAGNHLYERSPQEVHQRWHEVNQRETWRTETRKSKTFWQGLQDKSSTSLLISKTISSLLVKTWIQVAWLLCWTTVRMV